LCQSAVSYSSASEGNTMPRDPGWVASIRLVLVITGIIVVVAIAVGIKDYVQKSPASTSTPTVVPSNVGTLPKKSTAARTRRARMSATKANDHAPIDNPEGPLFSKPLFSKPFGNAGAKAQAVHEVAEEAMDRAAMERNNRVRSKFNTITTCVPLPNGTKPGEVDAAYYEGWAREYGCLVVPKSPPK